MYDYCVKRIPPPKKIVFIKICIAHFSKIVAKTIDSKYKNRVESGKVEAKEYKEFRAVLIECIQLLSLCRNITDMDETFKHVVRLLLSPKQKSANSSIIVLTNRVRKNSEALQEIKLEADDIEDDMILFKELKKDGIYRNSPFLKDTIIFTSKLRVR